MNTDASKMTEEELREELKRIREERSGKGRVKRAQARTRRIDGVVKDKKRKADIQAVESAEWV